MDKIRTVGVDLAKNVIQVVGYDARGREVHCKRLSRNQMLRYFANLQGCRVGMEACASAHHWARELQGLGHEVRLIAPQYVRPYRRGQKNDVNDARAVGEALQVAQMRFVPVKTRAQQDLQSLVRLRQAAVSDRTAQGNRLRSLLAEYGVVLSKGVEALRRGFLPALEDERLSPSLRRWLGAEWRHWQSLDERAEGLRRELSAAANEQTECQRLQSIPGFGPVVAAVFASVIGDGAQYRRGRDAAAAIGLVPRQHSSGGKTLLLGISKRGDKHLRSVLVHGARAVVQHAAGKDDPLSQWINRVRARRGFNKACVALANKLARIGWAVLRQRGTYEPARARG